MSDQKKVLITEGRYQPAEAMLQVHRKSSELCIGIPKETTLQENRVALVPASVATLVAHGHRVVMEAGAGENTSYSDHTYSEAGAEIAYDPRKVYQSDIVLKIAPPTLDEIDLLTHNQVLISPIHLPLVSETYLRRLMAKKCIALAMEYIKDEHGSFPVVRIMSEMAGRSAMLIAGELLSRSYHGKGILLGGVSGVPPAKVVIIGAGVVAEFAVRVAIGLGAEVRVFDNNVYKLMRLQNRVGVRLNTSTLNPFQLEKELLNAEVVIGAIHSKTGRSPMLVTEEVVSRMKEGAVIIDVSIDQGGCFATSEVTTHDNPTFQRHGVTHYCVPNIASRIPRTASIAISNILTPILTHAGTVGSLENLIRNEAGIRNGVYVYKGKLTNEYLGDRFQMNATNLDLLMSSSY